MKSDADHEKALAEMRERMLASAASEQAARVTQKEEHIMSYTENSPAQTPVSLTLHRPAKLAYRVAELADATGMSDWFIRREIQSGRLRAKKLGSAVVIFAEDAMAWLSSLTDAPHETNAPK